MKFSLCWISNQVNPISTNRAHLIFSSMEICTQKRFSACNSRMLQPFNKKHTKLNRPHREVPFDILTIRSAITARLRNRAEKSGIRNRYYWEYCACVTTLHTNILSCREAGLINILMLPWIIIYMLEQQLSVTRYIMNCMVEQIHIVHDRQLY